ncbi:tRNA (adenosine(37)-N6)-threonylcarbamoyltransferase complex ATPase subunit type 1 TsaE [Falsiphaeobacter marinintestinus]|uniref:tRNA (adenosine(37)-N6)-threonylcarbamoyltransferase complex ATPase subunit type 1 TsaE n=1 Tax=Falsiphaeobacter marinintestinus TaxID=1492905 RepID=UPI0011B7A9B4|nr:tRNA (adenosine(37)-N6)-threonylcarbamoyltransferase complex ATPase subunit type 1 TsaE [Phaeobacter marinintestinus]
MTTTPVTLTLTSPDDTAALAQTLGRALGAGDCLLLNGPIGAGKTHFSRHLIQSRLDTPEDVPSPTFTLVQTYQAGTAEIWHADLYRLSSVDEVEELGLSEAFETAICLVEWPEKLGPLTPRNALTLTFQPDPADEETRILTLGWTDPKWTPIVKALPK